MNRKVTGILGNIFAVAVRGKIFRVVIMALGILVFASCKEDAPSPYSTPELALDYALDSLYSHNYDAYLRSVDTYGAFSEDVMRRLMEQYVEGVEQEKGVVVSCDVQNVEYLSDSVATVYYKLSFSTGTSEVSSQKLLKSGAEWKLCIRN